MKLSYFFSVLSIVLYSQSAFAGNADTFSVDPSKSKVTVRANPTGRTVVRYDILVDGRVITDVYFDHERPIETNFFEPEILKIFIDAQAHGEVVQILGDDARKDEIRTFPTRLDLLFKKTPSLSKQLQQCQHELTELKTRLPEVSNSPVKKVLDSADKSDFSKKPGTVAPAK